MKFLRKIRISEVLGGGAQRTIAESEPTDRELFLLPLKNVNSSHRINKHLKYIYQISKIDKY